MNRACCSPSTVAIKGLAGVLLATTIHMIKPSELKKLASESWLNAILLVFTAVLTVFVDMISAIAIGILLAVTLRKTKLARKIDRRVPPVNEKETLGD